MLKFFKTLVIFIIALLIFSSSVFATDINMNLQPNETTNETATDINQTTDDGNNVDNTQNPVDDGISGDAAPSDVSSIAQENMSFSNILNILIITVGVILILLAIAILIRLKN